jgi:DNA helicase HerA-like ATPase
MSLERRRSDHPQRFGISATDQRQHIYIIGKTGSGKTTLLRNLILQHLHVAPVLGKPIATFLLT